jgi:hypothetical protein
VPDPGGLVGVVLLDAQLQLVEFVLDAVPVRLGERRRRGGVVRAGMNLIVSASSRRIPGSISCMNSSSVPRRTSSPASQ